MTWSTRAGRAALGWMFTAMCALSGCGEDSESPGDDAGTDAAMGLPPLMSREALLDPKTCSACHPRHYREWASSMHAYAAKDPVFLAMNARGQRETDGGLGDFCVNCHAPMAVREGLTKDGLNLDEIPEAYKGVTCYFCHNAIGVEVDDKGNPIHHNGKLVLANDTTMRGSIKNPVNPGVHGVAYSEAHDRNSLKSSELCGACHDIVTPDGVHLERTYKEYLESAFSKAPPGQGFDTCQGCHMDPSPEPMHIAQVPGLDLPRRYMHEHLWPGVDVALTDDFPDQEAQRVAVECALAYGTTLIEFSANEIGNRFTIILETEAGHAQPSGATQDRRLWIEFLAYDDADNLIYQSGHIGDMDIEEVPEGELGYDPDLRLFRDRIYGADGQQVHMFWDASPSQLFPTGVESKQMPFAKESVFEDHFVKATYTLNVLPARVEARMRMRPMGMDTLRDLVESGDLDEAFLERIPTFTLHGTVVEWTRDQGAEPITGPSPLPVRCPDDYLKLLEPKQ